MMKRVKYVIIATVCIVSCHSIFAQNDGLSSSEKHAIRAFVNDLQYGRKELVAAAIRYPMARPYPLTPIKTEKEFIEHYDDFIDTPFIESVRSAKWERIGWRGICCGSGILWGDVDDNGEFYAHSYWLTPKGESVWKETVEKQRERLYPALRTFKKPVFMFKTVKFIIRVDMMSDDSYRYASWSLGHDISSKPDLIVMGGAMTDDGSLHLEYYAFKNGDYEYEVGPGIRSQDYDYELMVSKKGEVLMTQQGNLYY